MLQIYISWTYHWISEYLNHSGLSSPKFGFNLSWWPTKAFVFWPGWILKRTPFKRSTTMIGLFQGLWSFGLKPIFRFQILIWICLKYRVYMGGSLCFQRNVDHPFCKLAGPNHSTFCYPFSKQDKVHLYPYQFVPSGSLMDSFLHVYMASYTSNRSETYMTPSLYMLYQ